MPEELPRDPNNENADETSVSESLKKSLDSRKKIEDVASSHVSLIKKMSNEEESINDTLSERLSIAEDLKNSLKEFKESIKNSSQFQQKNIGESIVKPALQEPQKQTAPVEVQSTKTTPDKETSDANKESKKAKPSDKTEKPKPVTQEVNVKIKVDSSSLEKELNLVNQIIATSQKFETQKNQQIKFTLESRLKESKVNSDLVKSTERQSKTLEKNKNTVSESVKQTQKESNITSKISDITNQVSEKVKETSKDSAKINNDKSKELKIVNDIIKLSEKKETASAPKKVATPAIKKMNPVSPFAQQIFESKSPAKSQPSISTVKKSETSTVSKKAITTVDTKSTEKQFSLIDKISNRVTKIVDLFKIGSTITNKNTNDLNLQLKTVEKINETSLKSQITNETNEEKINKQKQNELFVSKKIVEEDSKKQKQIETSEQISKKITDISKQSEKLSQLESQELKTVTNIASKQKKIVSELKDSKELEEKTNQKLATSLTQKIETLDSQKELNSQKREELKISQEISQLTKTQESKEPESIEKAAAPKKEKAKTVSKQTAPLESKKPTPPTFKIPPAFPRMTPSPSRKISELADAKEKAELLSKKSVVPMAPAVRKAKSSIPAPVAKPIIAKSDEVSKKESQKTKTSEPALSKTLRVVIIDFEKNAEAKLTNLIKNNSKNAVAAEKTIPQKEITVAKKAKESTKAKAKTSKDKSEKTLASKAVPEPVEMSNSVKKTISASQELNTTMKKGEFIEESMVNMSSARVKQLREQRLQQEKINENKKEELTVSQKNEEVVKVEDKKKKGGTKKEKSEETVTKAAATPAPTPAATPPAAAPTPPPNSGESKIQGPKYEDYEKGLESAKALAETAKEIAKFEGYASENQKQNIKLLDKSIQQRESVTSAVEAAREEGRDLEGIEKSISKNVKDRVFAENRLKEIVSSGTVDVKHTLSLMNEIESALQEEEEANRKIATIKRDLAIQGVTEIEQIHNATKAEQERALKATARVETLRNSIQLEQAEYIAIQQSIKQYQQIDTSLKNQLKHQKELNDKMGIFGKSIQVIGGVLDHYGVGKFLKINDAIDAMKKKAEEGGNKLQVMMAGLGSLGKTFAKMLTDPVAILTGAIGIFTYLVKAAVEFQSKNFEIAKTLGVSVKNAEGLRKQFEAAASANGKLALTGHELVDTYAKMTDQLGFMAPTQNEMVQSATLIMRRFGVTAENMDRIYVSSVKNKKSVMDTFAAVVGTGKETAARLKIQMSEKQIMEAVSKVSDTVYRNFKGNTIALASAVVEAKKMGMTLDQVNKIGDSMLNFEDSISKEMEAQLLTGKNIDLSKARQFALTGDTKNLMKEINKQVGSQAEYEKMNVIQRQSYAEALGMTREEMDKMYTDQERVNKLGNLAQLSETEQYNALVKKGKSHKEIAAIMGEQSAKSAESASVQEKLASAMTRIQEAIGAASQALMPIITRVTDWLSNTHNVEKVIHKVEKALGLVNRAFMFTLNTVKGIVSFFKPMIGFLMKQSWILKGIAGTYLAIKASQMVVRGVTAAQNVISGISLMIKKKENQTLDSTIVKSAALGIKEKANAGFSVAGAIAKVTGGAGYLGPGALIVGGIAATMLMGYLSKLGAGSSGGGSESASMPDMKDMGGGAEMKPLNQAAETTKTINNSLTRSGADVKRSNEGINLTVVNKMDAIQGKGITQVMNDGSYHPDSSKIAAPNPK